MSLHVRSLTQVIVHRLALLTCRILKLFHWMTCQPSATILYGRERQPIHCIIAYTRIPFISTARRPGIQS